VEQGGKPLNTTGDLTDRVLALGQFAGGLDPNFEYKISFGRAQSAPAVYAETPFMMITRTKDGERVTYEAYLRQEATSEARFGFTDDDAGQQARDKARLGIAAGESVGLSGGIWLNVAPAPIVAKQTHDEFIKEGVQKASITMVPGAPRDLKLRVERDGRVVSRQFEMRPIPPVPGADAALGGALPGLLLTMDFRLPGPPKVRVGADLSYLPIPDAAANAEAAQFVLDFFHADRTVFVAAGFLPDDGIDVDQSAKAQVPESTLEQLAVTAQFYAAIATIQAKHGPLPVPEAISDLDLAQVVRSRRSSPTRAVAALLAIWCSMSPSRRSTP
jgi:hypothetical protein